MAALSTQIVERGPQLRAEFSRFLPKLLRFPESCGERLATGAAAWGGKSLLSREFSTPAEQPGPREIRKSETGLLATGAAPVRYPL